MLRISMHGLTSRMPRLKGLLMTTSPGHSRLWVAAVVLLAAATIGANWFFYFRDAGQPAHTATADDALDDQAASANIVCFGHVDVEYGTQSLYPLQSGRVKDVFVHSGETVKANMELLRLDDRHARNVLKEAEADVQAAQAQYEQATLGIEQHRSKSAQQKSAIAAARSRHSAAKHALERKKKLREKEQLSREEVDAANDLVEEAHAALDAEKEKEHELAAFHPQLLIDRAAADLAAKEARRDQAQQALDECSLRAPADGEVLRVLVGKGDVLGSQPTKPAVQFCPKKPLLIRAEVSQEFAGRVRAGQQAWVQEDTSAAESWHAKVVRVSRWYTQRRSIMQEPLQVNDVRTLECIIAFDDPNAPPLRIGQRMRITIGDSPAGN